MTKRELLEEIERIENNIKEMGVNLSPKNLKRFKKEELKRYLEEITERNYILYYK